MVVLLVGDADLTEINLLADAVAERGETAKIFDVTDWPGDAPLTFRPDDGEVTFGTSVSLDEVSGMYVSSHHIFPSFDPRLTDYIEEGDPIHSALRQFREYRGLFESLCESLEHRGATVVPPLRNHDWQHRKPWQLDLYTSSDLPVPETIFTNEPAEVHAFADRHEKVVYKAVTRGGSPHILSAADLTDERLENLATAPVQFQAYVPGEDLRVYAIEGEVVGAIRYESENFSFKIDQTEGKEIDFHPIELPDAVVETVERAAGRSALKFAAADVRLHDGDEHWVLELNEAARFAAADKFADQDIAGALAEYLLS